MMKGMIRVENNDSSISFFIFFLVIAIYFISFLKNQAKKRKQQQAARVSPPRWETEKKIPPIIQEPILPVVLKSKKEELKQVTAIPSPKKRMPRIARVVGGLRSKKELILISEILQSKL